MGRSHFDSPPNPSDSFRKSQPHTQSAVSQPAPTLTISCPVSLSLIQTRAAIIKLSNDKRRRRIPRGWHLTPLPQPSCIWREEGKSSQAYRSTQSRKHREHKAYWTVSAPVRPTSPEASVQYAEKTSGLIIAMIRSAVTWSHGCNCIISASLNLGIATHGYKCVRKRGEKAFSAIEKHTNRS